MTNSLVVFGFQFDVCFSIVPACFSAYKQNSRNSLDITVSTTVAAVKI